MVNEQMRTLEQEYLETVIYLTGHDEKKSAQVTSGSFFGMVNTFVESFFTSVPTAVTREEGTEQTAQSTRRRERKFGLGKKIVKREIMEGIKLGVKLKKTSGPQPSKKMSSGSALSQIMSKTMLQRRKKIDTTTAAAFGDSDDEDSDWED